jgi:hypothetical protein
MVMLWKSLLRNNVFFTWRKCSEWIHSHRILPFQRNKFWPLFRELKEVTAINILCKNWRTVFDRTSQCFKQELCCVSSIIPRRCWISVQKLKVSTVRLLFKIKLNYRAIIDSSNSWGYGIKLLRQLPCWAKGVILHCVIWPTFRISVWKCMDFNVTLFLKINKLSYR